MNAEKSKQEVSSTGRMMRVLPTFAYLTSKNYGCVFIPPNAALPTHCNDPDLTKFYKTGDIVHFLAVPQLGKNDCSWLATKVVISPNSELYQAGVQSAEELSTQPSMISDKVGMVTTVTDTFAFLTSDVYGPVFMPGGAFESNDQSDRLTTRLFVNDLLLFSARSQTLHNGCRWLALSAVRMNVNQENCEVNTNDYFKETSSPPIPYLSGMATVRLVGPMAAVVFNADFGLVYCSVMTWTGGESDHSGAESLQDVLQNGDSVHVRAVPLTPNDPSDHLGCMFRAVHWGLSRKIAVRDSTSQTVRTNEEMLINGLRRRNPTLFAAIKLSMPNLAEFANL